MFAYLAARRQISIVTQNDSHFIETTKNYHLHCTSVMWNHWHHHVITMKKLWHSRCTSFNCWRLPVSQDWNYAQSIEWDAGGNEKTLCTLTFCEGLSFTWSSGNIRRFVWLVEQERTLFDVWVCGSHRLWTSGSRASICKRSPPRFHHTIHSLTENRLVQSSVFQKNLKHRRLALTAKEFWSKEVELGKVFNPIHL